MIDHNLLAVSLSSHTCPACGQQKKMGERWCWDCRKKVGAGWSNKCHFASWKKRAKIVIQTIVTIGGVCFYCPDGSNIPLENSGEKKV